MKLNLSALLASLALFGAEEASARSETLETSPPSVREAQRNKPAAVERHQKIKQKFPTRADVVLVGDSMVRRWTPEGLHALFGKEHLLNLGVGGDRTENVLWRLGDLPLGQISPKTAVIFVGTNNLTRKSDGPSDIVSGVEAIVKKVRSAWPDVAISVIPILPRGPDFSFREKDRVEINERLALNPSYRFVHVDEAALTCIQPLQASASGCPNYNEDRLHLLPPGYAIVNQALAEALNARR